MLTLFDDLHIIFLKQNFNSNPIFNKLRDKIFEIYDNKMAEERLDTANKPITLENIS